MLCPSCNDTNNKVIDSRMTEGGSVIRRRRVCSSCERRFTTKERVEQELRLTVCKVSGQRVSYQRDKVYAGIERACYKLDVTEEQIQQLVDRIEEELFANHDREVTTEHIGAYVGLHLRRLNQIAYVRFMSVHRKFNTVEQFVEEITDIKLRVSQDNPSQQDLFGNKH